VWRGYEETVRVSYVPSFMFRWQECTERESHEQTREQVYCQVCKEVGRLVTHCFQVCVEGRLYLEFMFDDMMRIKTWHFSIRQHRELIPRSILAMHVSCGQNLRCKGEGRWRKGWNKVCHFLTMALERERKFLHLKNGFLHSSPFSLSGVSRGSGDRAGVSRCNPGASIPVFYFVCSFLVLPHWVNSGC